MAPIHGVEDGRENVRGCGMTHGRGYFRTSSKEVTDGLIENFRLNKLPANPAVCLDFGIMGEEAERQFDALRWMWERGGLDRAQLIALKGDGPKLTRVVSIADNPFAPVAYQTIWDDVRAWEAAHHV